MSFYVATPDVASDDIGLGVALLGGIAGIVALSTMVIVRKESFPAFAVKSIGAGILAAAGFVAGILAIVVMAEEDAY